MLRIILFFALLTMPALAQTEGRFDTISVINRDASSATMSVYRFNGGVTNVHEIGSRFYCQEAPDATGSSYCVSVEVESDAVEHSIGRVALNLKARRTEGAGGRVSALHVAVNDRSGLSATEAQGVILAESGLETYGPDDYGVTPLGFRQGWRFSAKGDGETGTGWAALTGSRHPRATLNTGFYAAEVNGHGRINAGFRCDIEGTCLVVESARFGIDLNGSDVILRQEDGRIVTLLTELARLKAQVAQLNARVARLTAEE